MKPNDIVPYQMANAVKLLGFTEKCLHYYAKSSELLYSNYQFVSENDDILMIAVDDLYVSHNSIKDSESIDAPTLSQVQNWLRGKGMDVFVDPVIMSKDNIKYKWSAIIAKNKFYVKDPVIYFDTYEMALTVGLYNCINILLKI